MKNIVFQRWQIKKLLFWFLSIIIIGGGYISYATYQLHNDKSAESSYWQNAMTDPNINDEFVQSVSKDATHVYTGTYMESLKEVNMRSSYYRMVCTVWFRWQGDESLDMAHNFFVYNGTMNKIEYLKDEVVDGWNYQQCRMDVTVYKNFWTKRFPLESHQLRFYIEPTYSVDRVILEQDGENSSINPNLNVPGFELVRSDTSTFTNISNTSYGEPGIEKSTINSEFMTQLELNRNGLGLYTKCFIALFGTSLWVFITMFLCTYHRVDPLGMIPAALFGTVSNIMVGANLLPDSLQVGLLEYVNGWGILTIIAGALTIININRIRNKYNDTKFAALFGRIICFTLVAVVILGHILMPLSAYLSM